MKKEKREYEKVMEEMEIESEDCVLVEEKKKNIEGEEEVKMKNVKLEVKRNEERYEKEMKMIGI